VAVTIVNISGFLTNFVKINLSIIIEVEPAKADKIENKTHDIENCSISKYINISQLMSRTINHMSINVSHFQSL
jgi:hypothetical protein